MHRDSSNEDDAVAMPEPEALATPARLASRQRLLVRLAVALATVALLGVVGASRAPGALVPRRLRRPLR
jgi:hypothetical protein